MRARANACTQTGKSYTLREVVPVVMAKALAEALSKDPQHPLRGAAVLRLDGMALDRRVCCT